MALVDENCRFICIDIAWNGRCNDDGVLLESNLKKNWEEEKDVPQKSVVGNDRYLPYVEVGDDAFH